MTGPTSKRRQWLAAGAAVLLVLAVLGGFFLVLAQKESRYFQESARYVQNPMQGFYVQVDSAEPERIGRLPEDGINMVLLACNLNGYQERPLDDEKLLELERALAAAKAARVQVVFRAAYGFSEGWDTVEPAALEVALGHIGQLANVLNRYAGHILCVQAGMLGPWGEWHSSALWAEDDPDDQARVRNAVAGEWLRWLDPVVILQLRRPLFVRQAVASGLPLERLGFHNDALLSDEGDMGTYRDEDGSRRDALEWVADHLPDGVFGGEMPKVSAYTRPDNAVAEFRLLHLTYLNSRYNTEVLEDWQSLEYQGENALEYITRHMGSRLYLSHVELPRYARWEMHVSIGSSGFAPAPARLSYYWVYKQGESVLYVAVPPGAVDRQAEGGVSLAAVMSPPKHFDREQPWALGLWAGYGSPREEGLAFTLANDDLRYEDGVAYFADYDPHWTGWVLQQAE